MGVTVGKCGHAAPINRGTDTPAVWVGVGLATLVTIAGLLTNGSVAHRDEDEEVAAWPRWTSPRYLLWLRPYSSRSATPSSSAWRTTSLTSGSVRSRCSPGCCATRGGGWAA